MVFFESSIRIISLMAIFKIQKSILNPPPLPQQEKPWVIEVIKTVYLYDIDALSLEKEYTF